VSILSRVITLTVPLLPALGDWVKIDTGLIQRRNNPTHAAPAHAIRRLQPDGDELACDLHA
jgi:hypothetical protein